MHKYEARHVVCTRVLCKYCFSESFFRQTFLFSPRKTQSFMHLRMDFVCSLATVKYNSHKNREEPGKWKYEILCFNIVLKTTINFHTRHTKRAKFAFNNFIFPSAISHLHRCQRQICFCGMILHLRKSTHKQTRKLAAQASSVRKKSNRHIFLTSMEAFLSLEWMFV